jgi:taurine dioxygenase
MANGPIGIRPASSAIGAEISGVDLAEPLDNATWSAIHDAFHQYQVLFFRDQEMTPQQHVDFSRRFGNLVPYPFVHGIEGYPELIDIVKMPNEIKNFGAGWHADMSFSETPPLGAVLYAIEVPPSGGDTMFCNMTLAYETLSVGMKAYVDAAKGVHDSHDPKGHSQGYKGMSLWEKEGAKREIRVHPMVKTHPVTGAKSLFISPDYCMEIEGAEPGESRRILDHLERHATRDEFTCRFRWEPNSVVIWDNRCIMHKALNDDLGARLTGEGFKRVVRRATVGQSASRYSLSR